MGYRHFAIATALGVGLSAGGLTACFFSESAVNQALSSTSSTILAADVDSDGAPAMCESYDLGSDERGFCSTCFDTVLAAQPSCPQGSTDFSTCTDAYVVQNYQNLVNQCLAASLVSGQVCNQTCGSGQVINPTTCTCVTAPPPAGGPPIDTGAQDWGPPIAIATQSTVFAVASTGATSCESDFHVELAITNRPGAPVQLNNFSTSISNAVTTTKFACVAPSCPGIFSTGSTTVGTPTYQNGVESLDVEIFADFDGTSANTGLSPYASPNFAGYYVGSTFVISDALGRTSTYCLRYGFQAVWTGTWTCQSLVFPNGASSITAPNQEASNTPATWFEVTDPSQCQ